MVELVPGGFAFACLVLPNFLYWCGWGVLILCCLPSLLLDHYKCLLSETFLGRKKREKVLGWVWAFLENRRRRLPYVSGRGSVHNRSLSSFGGTVVVCVSEEGALRFFLKDVVVLWRSWDFFVFGGNGCRSVSCFCFAFVSFSFFVCFSFCFTLKTYHYLSGSFALCYSC